MSETRAPAHRGAGGGLQPDTIQRNTERLSKAADAVFGVAAFPPEFHLAAQVKLEALRHGLDARFRPVVTAYPLWRSSIIEPDGRMIQNPAAEAFFRYIEWSQLTWRELLRRGGSAVDMTTEEYLPAAKAPGTWVIEAAGEASLRLGASEETTRQGLAYALFCTDKRGIHDLSDFPRWIQKLPKLARLREVLRCPPPPTALSISPTA